MDELRRKRDNILCWIQPGLPGLLKRFSDQGSHDTMFFKL